MRITLSEHRAEFAQQFETERRWLLQQLHVLQPSVVHIGSTAVPELKAKPIVDLMVGLAGEQDLDAAVQPILTDQRYLYVPHYEAVMPYRRFFIKFKTEALAEHWRQYLRQTPQTSTPLLSNIEVEHRSHHLHVVAQQHPFWEEHLRFRDLLRQQPTLRQAYEDLKVRLSQQDWLHLNDYAVAKSDFIAEAMRTFE